MVALTGTKALAARRLPVFLTGLYTWSVTVAPGMLDDAAPSPAHWTGIASLLCLVASVVSPRNFWSVLFGIEGYFVCCAFTWWVLREAGQPVRPGVFGLLGWFAYTLGWGALSRPLSHEDQEGLVGTLEEGPSSRSRVRSLPAMLILGGLFLAPLLLAGPMLLERPAISVLALMLVLALVLVLLRVGAEAGAAHYGSSPPIDARRRLKKASASFSVLVLLLIAGYLLGFLGAV